MSTKRLFWMMAISAFVLVSAQSQAQEEAQAPQQEVNIPPKDKEGPIPQLINYQGNLSDSNGQPANGTFAIVFKIYDAATEGTALYTETQTVAVSNGSFNVLLGSVTPIPLNLFESGTARFLEIIVNNTVMTPRRQFGSVPYAFSSGTTSKSTSGGNIVPGGWDWDNLGGTVVRLTDSADNVGIGTASPGAKLEVRRGDGFLIGKFKNSATSGDRTALIDIETGDATPVLWRMGVGGAGNGLGLTAGQFYLERGGAGARVVVNTSGNVGIGTTAPLFKLDMQPVSSNARLGKAEIGAWPANPNFFAYFGHEALNHTLSGNYALLQGSSGDTYLNAALNQSIGFRISNATRMILTSTGNVGIGVTTPFTKLTLNGSLGFTNASTPMMYIYQSGVINAERPIISHSPSFTNFGISYNDVADQMLFKGNGTPVMAVDLANLRVGIGTTSPTSKLHVIGTFTATGTKAATVETESFGKRKLYAVESATVRFTDEGTSKLQNGTVKIVLDPVFIETIEGELAVHLTAYGPTGLYVAEKGDTYFVVNSLDGKDIEFAWQVSAVRKGYTNVRLEISN